MKTIKFIFPLVFLLCVFPMSAFADAGWPTLLIAVSPVLMWYIGIVSILIEAAVLWYWLRPGFGKALLMSLVANTASLIVGFVLGGLGVGYLGGSRLGASAVAVTVFDSWYISWVLMLLLTIAVEMSIIKVIWKYSWRKLWLPVIVMNILTYLIIEAQHLKDIWSW